MTMMKMNKVLLVAVLFLAASVALTVAMPAPRDEFAEVVGHIESHYNVHRNYRFIMGFAGLVVKVSHVGGVKAMKTAIFEDQRLSGSGSDQEFDELMRKALKSGWRPVVQSHSRRNGEHTYIYARGDGRDLKVFLATVEPSEAVVMELKVDPDKLAAFINEHTGPGKGHHRKRYADDDEDETAQLLPPAPSD
jgi:hypothetical protein